MSIRRAMEICKSPEKYSREEVNTAAQILHQVVTRAMTLVDTIRETLPKEGNYV